MSEPTTPRPLGLLAPGIRPRNMIAYMFVALVTSGLAGGIGMLQPGVLALMGIPHGEQGNVTGTLGLVQEIVFIVAAGLYGVLSDRIGRRPVYVGGLMVVGLGYALYPRAGSIDELLVYRALYAVGAAAMMAMLVAVVSDYANERARGRINAIQGFVVTIGAFLPIILVILPSVFVGRGFSQRDAQELAFVCAAGLAGLGAIVAALGLTRALPARAHAERVPLLRTAAQGLAAARDPGVALSYGAAFISRGDLAVTGSFMILWLTQYGTGELGLPLAEAQSNARPMVMMTVLGALLGALAMGWLADRVRRVTAVSLAAGLGALVYSAMFFVDDPTAPYVRIVLLVMGIAEIGAFVASQALVGQQAPAEIRGSVVGFFGVAGGLGILTGTFVAGRLFSAVGPSAPFVMFGALNAAVFVWSLVVRRRVNASERR